MSNERFNLCLNKWLNYWLADWTASWMTDQQTDLIHFTDRMVHALYHPQQSKVAWSLSFTCFFSLQSTPALQQPDTDLSTWVARGDAPWFSAGWGVTHQVWMDWWIRTMLCWPKWMDEQNKMHVLRVELKDRWINDFLTFFLYRCVNGFLTSFSPSLYLCLCLSHTICIVCSRSTDFKCQN